MLAWESLTSMGMLSNTDGSLELHLHSKNPPLSSHLEAPLPLAESQHLQHSHQQKTILQLALHWDTLIQSPLHSSNAHVK